jgi:hypothetical protein
MCDAQQAQVRRVAVRFISVDVVNFEPELRRCLGAVGQAALLAVTLYQEIVGDGARMVREALGHGVPSRERRARCTPE